MRQQKLQLYGTKYNINTSIDFYKNTV